MSGMDKGQRGITLAGIWFWWSFWSRRFFCSVPSI